MNILKPFETSDRLSRGSGLTVYQRCWKHYCLPTTLAVVWSKTHLSVEQVQFSFHVPTKILFGVDSSVQLAQECQALSIKSAFLVTDPGVERAGIADAIRGKLKGKVSVTTFNEVEPEPEMRVGEKVVDKVRGGKFDGIIGLGGGSALDIAKIASLAATNAGPLSDYAKGIFNIDTFPRRGLSMILLPTTAGTGSDVSPTSMLISGHSKIFLQGRFFFPDVAIIDPRLTLSMPPKVTAATGCDALTHAVEGYLSKGASPLTDPYALQAVRLIGRYLPRAYTNGNDLEARSGMCEAALLAGIVLRAGMIYGHSIAYTIATRYGLPHGVSTAIALPYVMEYNMPLREARLAQLAIALDEKAAGLTEHDAAVSAIRGVAKLLEDVGIPLSLKRVGANRDVLGELAKECVGVYPRPLNPRSMNESEASVLYERMYEGQLLV
jgi:alcohol dehydrogenase class IV